MAPATRTPEGELNRCPICGRELVLLPSRPPGDAPCPHCGALVWFSTPNSPGFPVISLPGSAVQDKEGAIRAIVSKLVQQGRLSEDYQDDVVKRLLKRESLGSTAIGRGIAIPHTTHDSVDRLVGVLAQIPEGIPFDSSDGKPVHTVCLIVAPVARPGEHLRALETVARWLTTHGLK